MRKFGIVAVGVYIVVGVALYWMPAGDAVASKSEKASDAAATENTLCIPLGSILIEPPEAIEPKKSPVEFPHSNHFGYSCQTCHHTWEGDAQLFNCTTSGCHDLTQFPKKSGKAETDPGAAAKYFKTAYHRKCIGCHKDIKRQNRDLEKSFSASKTKIMETGPTRCVGCHPRE